MSIEYRSTWLRVPDDQDTTELAHALARHGDSLGAPAGEVVLEIVFRPRTDNSAGPDVTLYADTEGALVSFHAGTRAQRSTIVLELDRVLSSRGLGTPLEEE